VAVEGTAKTRVGPPAEQVGFGFIKSLKRSGARYGLRFDPAWFLSGVAANVAAAEDGVVPAGQPVPNDNYVVNESHRPFTYVVPANALVTVLKRGVESSPITVAQLAQLVAGKSPSDAHCSKVSALGSGSGCTSAPSARSTSSTTHKPP
jgi:hypothetical protein